MWTHGAHAGIAALGIDWSAEFAVLGIALISVVLLCEAVLAGRGLWVDFFSPLIHRGH
jgi:hypothetical protein